MATEKTALNDPDNVLMVEITPEEERGMSVEDAYRHLAGLPPAPVAVEEQEEEK
jgi:hypothetical protein